MRRNNKQWLYVVAFIVFAICAVTFNAYNTIQVCKTQDVYWVSGTQHTCKWFK
ncbi:hypothetical protein RFI36_04770 [Acinetobacter gerneri]|uniref:TMhelix containing protein n=1 Tax=Acinetobacter gerneri TaxID=202952 RepID=A0AAW8JIH7_9GAMM|nr:hypothetical protein [Acinetobacter gerneri]MDQ9009017.1 hypothetical protein [Acinetobacter gerneri]MDQ9013121.1 hypothetical protein [Acinetobacter gerneri]MDQ9024558.1 hypothetical protein [Acinetobacter gerneri]MDQ9051793.1 hypothetical protein [Acinetobacter gerneri]MDQ9059226.1 hypothetical protein [Acinetobacter gerneri]